ncbi:Fic protein [Nocardioidaceae bacterium Broad-1]|nr:Fic protein [Nocardioidaceae bacterium Broad-1]
METRFPFLSFEYDTRKITTRTWFLMGEAMSKCQHLAGAPLKPAAASELASIYLAKGVQATTAIEGNTLSDDEVRAIVDSGTAGVPESRDYLQREVQNVLACITEIDEALHNGHRLPIDRERLCALNARILEGIPDSPEVVPGQLREHDVVAGTYKAPHYTEVPALVDQFTGWINQLRDEAAKATRNEDRFTAAVLAAVLAHVYLVWVHPFGNGNGRLARLIEVQLLSESGVVPLVATNLLSNHYNKTRQAYYLALDEAQRDISAFIQYAVLGFTDELRDQVARVRAESKAIHWESYVYEVFRKQPNTDSRSRQRDLALTMSGEKAITPEEATVLTASIAKKYALCGERTPARDLNALSKMGLVRKRPGRRYVANRAIIEAFIPPVATI